MENINFKIGQIIEGVHHPEVAEFCNNSQKTDNPCHLEEIEPVNGIRRFQIVDSKKRMKEELEKEKILQERIKFESELSSTDWYVIRYMDSGVSIPEEIKLKRQHARDEISRLREELEKL